MGKPRIFQVNFDNPHGVFYAGQPMTGTVHLVNDEELTLKGIKRFYS